MRLLTLLICPFLAGAVGAVELGYSLVELRSRTSCCESSRGVEGRIHFGNRSDKPQRYDDDRWALSISHVQPRLTDDGYIGTPLGKVVALDVLPAHVRIAFVHRWYTRKGRFGWAPQLRWFVGTGVSWTDVETCSKNGECFDGSIYVSNRWAFAQSLGFKWRDKVELAIEHDSTGRYSLLNRGADYLRFSIVHDFGR